MIRDPKDLKFRLTEVTENLFVIRDDLLPWGLGTKWRKFFGIYESLEPELSLKADTKRIILWGNLHSNYLAAFTYFFYLKKIPMFVFAYTKDKTKSSFNQTLVKNHSKTLFLFSSRSTAESEAMEWLRKNPDDILLPEFGMHIGVHQGLCSLWKDLEEHIEANQCSADAKKRSTEILLEIGSGQTYLSCFDYFYPKGIPVLGVSVGERKDSWLSSKREEIQKAMGLREAIIPEEFVFEPKDPKERRFRPWKNQRTDKIEKFLRETGIYLEPMYGGKILPFLLERKSSQTLYYLHQGGGYQHLGLLMANPNLVSAISKKEARHV